MLISNDDTRFSDLLDKSFFYEMSVLSLVNALSILFTFLDLARSVFTSHASF